MIDQEERSRSLAKLGWWSILLAILLLLYIASVMWVRPAAAREYSGEAPRTVIAEEIGGVPPVVFKGQARSRSSNLGLMGAFEQSGVTSFWHQIPVRPEKGHAMGLGTILLIILIICLLGAVPRWPYSTGWGYGPSSVLGVVILIVLILLLTGRL